LCFSGSQLTKTVHLSCTINTIDCTETHTQYQHSYSEQLEINAKLFNVKHKRKISTQEKVEKIQKI